MALLEPSDFKRFKVVSVLDSEQTSAELLEIATVDGNGGGYWISREWIRQAASVHAADESWQQKFIQMLEYAASKGWVDAETGAVLAHLASD
ncbi:hypothetical protein [Novosphingobium sp.]|uniref:hypothetical protein n=1 Tax=Novosphingobium sp. TaxID=1874826 RepID=UPI002733393C|nr:hypothetical protein [Novosphingobium sp.]MDP3905906.1 hypothetical protein [Novosphingobium sp.]